MFAFRSAAAAALALSGLFTAPLAAQTLAVPGVVPSDIQVLVSIHDTNSMWKAISAAPVRAEFDKLLALPAISGSPEFAAMLAEVSTASEQVGFDLRPDSMLGEAMNGLDFYVVKDEAGATQVLLASTFDSPDQASGLANFLKTKMTEQAGGDAGALSTTKVGEVELTTFGPGNITFGAQGNNFYATTSTGVLGSALTSTGVARLAEHTDFTGMYSQVASNKGQMLFYMNGEGLRELMAMAPQAGMTPPMQLGSVAGVINFLPDRVDSVYVSKATATSEAVKNLMNAPVTDLAVGKKLIGAESILSYTSALFEGDAILAAIDEQFGGPEMADSMFAEVESNLGFSVREDFFPAFGPNATASLNNIAMGAMIPDVDLYVALQIRDAEKAQKIKDSLEAFVAAALTQQAQSQNPSAPPTTVELEDYNGATIRSLTTANPMMSRPMGLVHATAGDHLIISLSSLGVKSAIDALNGDVANVTSAAAYRKAQSVLPAKASQLTVLNANKLGTTLATLAPMAFGMMGLGQEEATTAMTAFDVLKSLGTGYATTTYMGDVQMYHTSIIY